MSEQLSHFQGPLLLVEDEPNLGETLVDYLNTIGLEGHWAQNAESAKKLFAQTRPKVVLMDIGLPDQNGLELAREFRQKRQDFVLLFLSALNDPDTRVEGLEIGAEDYVTKPFALKELTLRLKRILASQASLEEMPEEITHGPLKIWFKSYCVQDASGNLINLSQKECAILELLYLKRNQAVTRDEIIENVWGEDKYPSNRTVDNYIVKLRKWSETDNDNHLRIVSVRGIGYKLTTQNP